MKFHFEIANCGGSFFDVHMFSMYEGSDCVENMAKVLAPYHKVICDMQKQDLRINGHKVKVFLGADFISLMMSWVIKALPPRFPVLRIMFPWNIFANTLQHLTYLVIAGSLLGQLRNMRKILTRVCVRIDKGVYP